MSQKLFSQLALLVLVLLCSTQSGMPLDDSKGKKRYSLATIIILHRVIRNRNVYTKIIEAGSMTRFNTEGGGDTFRFTSHTYIRYASKIMQPICKICVPHFGKKRVAILCFHLDLCGKSRIWCCGAFCQTRRNSGKSTVFQSFPFRNSINVRHTRRDKHGAQYATLISAATACLLHSF